MRMYFIVRRIAPRLVEASFEKFGPYFETEAAARKFAETEMPNRKYKILMVEAVLFE